MAIKLITGVNDLKTVNPLLAAEWDSVKNGDLLPSQVSSGSSKKVWWIGKCGHNWQATIASRNSGVGCLICARKNNASKLKELELHMPAWFYRSEIYMRISKRFILNC